MIPLHSLPARGTLDPVLGQSARFATCLVVILAVAGCRGDPPPPSPAAQPLRCRTSFEPPPGYELLDTQEEDQGPVTGVRAFYAGPDDSAMVFTSGVLMDMLENPTAADNIRLTNGSRASVTADGKDRWILFWNQPDPCHQYTIGADGVSLDGFLRLLRKSGVVSK